MKHIDWSPERRLSVMKALAERRNCLKKSVVETPGLPSKAHQMSVSPESILLKTLDLIMSKYSQPNLEHFWHLRFDHLKVAPTPTAQIETSTLYNHISRKYLNKK